MPKIDDFYKNLINIYGHEITDSLIVKKSNKEISFKQGKLGRTKFLIEYYLNLEKKKPTQIESCALCRNIFGNDFKYRPFEFSNWRGVLDFNKKNIKDIMIIGEAAGPDIKTHLNFSYGLTNLPIDRNGVMEWNEIKNLFNTIQKEILSSKLYDESKVKRIISKVKKKVAFNHKLWEYVHRIFTETDNNLEFLLNSLFNTDMVRCNLGETPKWKSNTIWERCIDNCKRFFFEEIKLINPKLILIITDPAYKTFTTLLNGENIKINKSKEIDFDKYLEPFPSRNFGNFTLNDNIIHFYHIYHNRAYYRLEKKLRRPLYNKRNQLFYSNELKPKVLHW